jgi:integrase
MATINKLSSGSWRVQVRRKGQYASQTFRLQKDAKRWATEIERNIDLGQPLISPTTRNAHSLSQIIDLHIDDMCDVGRAPLRSKAYSLELLRRALGHFTVKQLTRDVLIAFARQRAKNGAGPVTLSIDLGYIKTVLLHAAAVHGLPVSTEAVDQARIALKRLGLVGKGHERDRRPTPEELHALLQHLDSNRRLTIPVGRIVRFAIATGMRQDEICRLTWADLDLSQRTARIKKRKHPRDKSVNNQTIALVSDAGWDPIAIVQEQSPLTKSTGRIFPYNGRSVGTAFRRACRALNIEDLHFHDLRHETASRLFEAGYQIPEVALVTGHKDWKMLRRYTNLKPQDLALRIGSIPKLQTDKTQRQIEQTGNVVLRAVSSDEDGTSRESVPRATFSTTAFQPMRRRTVGQDRSTIKRLFWKRSERQ